MLSRTIDLYRKDGVNGIITGGKRWSHYNALKLNKKYLNRTSIKPNDKSIMDEDWDNLLLLDCCRLDTFEEVNYIDGELKKRISNGTATPEFLRDNFANSTHNDTVYITANPMHMTEDLGETFYDVIDVWDQDWDTELQTVPPERVVESTLKAYNKYPNKRLFVHFMQPHPPFMGKNGREITHAGIEYTYREAQGKEPNRDNPTVWDLLYSGIVSLDQVWAGYKENLEIVLDSVDDLKDELDGKSVITSDHGNLMGDRFYPIPFRTYGHYDELYVDELLEVPWLELEYNDRREIIEETPVSNEKREVDEGVVERLKDLGYKDRGK